jgi:hypothetical protein
VLEQGTQPFICIHTAQVGSASGPVRQQASQAASALAAAQPSAAARMLTALLAKLDAAGRLLGGVRAATQVRAAQGWVYDRAGISKRQTTIWSASSGV